MKSASGHVVKGRLETSLVSVFALRLRALSKSAISVQSSVSVFGRHILSWTSIQHLHHAVFGD